MSRVIDDDRLAEEVLLEWRCEGSPLEYLLRDLRKETPNWWNDIDMKNPATWVDAWAWNLGERERVLITHRQHETNLAGIRLYYSSTNRTYVNATPFIKPEKNNA